MKVFTKDSNNDLTLDATNNLSISNDLQAVLEACETAVSAQLGEMIYAVNDGVPNFQVIWNGNPNTAQAEASLRSVIQKVDNVIEVTELDSEIINNSFRYNATIRTNFGIVSISNGV